MAPPRLTLARAEELVKQGEEDLRLATQQGHAGWISTMTWLLSERRERVKWIKRRMKPAEAVALEA